MTKTKKKIRTAVIDVGTLKSKFEVREFSSSLDESKLLCREKELTVLGRDLDKTNGIIVRKAIENTIEALVKFNKIMTKLKVDKYKAVTTEAIRKAKNSKEVLAEIKKRTGVFLEILDHNDEAEIYFYSISKDFPGKTIAVSDIGGGSVQVVIGKDKSIYETYLFKTGTYFMQENLSKTHHPTHDELVGAKAYVKKEMSSLEKSKYEPKMLVYGSTNIIDFLKAMKVKLERRSGSVGHPYRTNIKKLYPIFEAIASLSYEDRMPMFPAEPYYMWSAENALLNVFQICEFLHITTIIPSNNNISSGILYELAESIKN